MAKMIPPKRVGLCAECRVLTEAAWSDRVEGYRCADCGGVTTLVAEPEPPAWWRRMRAWLGL